MDKIVLQAQQWVNATYKNVVGYEKCAEDGLTGWATMHSLTRALQNELKVTPLADGFGPATLAALKKRGGIGVGETNTNIVKILQCALYCKGYDPSGITGTFGLNTLDAVVTLAEDAGVASRWEGAIDPKLMKGILSMDAYVPLADGSSAVRSIQRWLNSRYLHRANFFLMPCDGLFSRDVVKYLVYAIQYEMGWPDSIPPGMTGTAANGVFGPTTQKEIKKHTVKRGSTGVFVQLFTAALVFNRYGSFTDSFGANTERFVKSFQAFSELPQSGEGDFATWAQLIISTGDIDRPGVAADCITTITDARAKLLFSKGYRYVGRYLDQRGTLDKKIKPGELETIFRNGLKVFPISQYSGGERKYFTFAQGYEDAESAQAAAIGYGFPKGTVIYFAVDYDAVQADIDNWVVPYFEGVASALVRLGRVYHHGVYGSRNVCRQVSSRTNARFSFVSGMSTAFSGNMGFTLPANWAFNQIHTETVKGGTTSIEIDKGIHKSNSDPAVSSLASTAGPVPAFLAYVVALRKAAVAYGSKNPDLLVLDYLRAISYDTDQWRMLFPAADWDFVGFTQGKQIARINRLREPQYGLDIDPAHVAATAFGIALPEAANRPALGDIAGWGGDFCTFYSEWQIDPKGTASGYVFCDLRMANTNVNSTFKLDDAVEDADGYAIGKAIKSGRTVVEAFTDQYTNGFSKRFTNFLSGRFAGSASGAAKAAEDWAWRTTDALVATAQQALYEQGAGGRTLSSPVAIPQVKMDPFFRGFGMVLSRLAGRE